MIERHVDYLQMNVHLQEADFLDNRAEFVLPVRFYKRGYRDAHGVRYYFGNPNSSKALVIMGGDALHSIRAKNVTDAEIIERYMGWDARCSRIDLAVTDYIEDDFCTVSDVKNWVREKLVKSCWIGSGTKSLSEMTEDGNERLETFYVGAWADRSKKGMFRAYDKGIQSGLEPDIITRLEVEDRQDKAHSTARRIAETNDIAGNFRARFDVSHEQFERIMEAPAVPTNRIGYNRRSEKDDEMASRWQWLINQVAPALKEAIEYDRVEDPNDTRLMSFLVEAGLMTDIRQFAENLADRKYRDKLYLNGLEPDETGGK